MKPSAWRATRRTGRPCWPRPGWPESRGDTAGLARAAISNSPASIFGITDHERVASLQAALDAVGPADSPARARLLAVLALELFHAADRGRRLSLSDEALAIARRLDDPQTLSHVLVARPFAIGGPDTLAQRLVEEQLTRRFGTSRAPLREALRLLGQQGLVEHLPRRGVRVAALSARDIDELFGLRDARARYAVQTALSGGRRPAPAALSRLSAAVADMERAVTGGGALAKASAHREFHLALVALAGHQHLMRAYEPVLLQLELYMATNMATNLRREAAARSPDEGAQRHRRLHEAVLAGDVDRVLAELARHGARTYLAPELGS